MKRWWHSSSGNNSKFSFMYISTFTFLLSYLVQTSPFLSFPGMKSEMESLCWLTCTEEEWEIHAVKIITWNLIDVNFPSCSCNLQVLTMLWQDIQCSIDLWHSSCWQKIFSILMIKQFSYHCVDIMDIIHYLCPCAVMVWFTICFKRQTKLENIHAKYFDNF